jgi:hypothetical protein
MAFGPSILRGTADITAVCLLFLRDLSETFEGFIFFLILWNEINSDVRIFPSFAVVVESAYGYFHIFLF